MKIAFILFHATIKKTQVKCKKKSLAISVSPWGLIEYHPMFLLCCKYCYDFPRCNRSEDYYFGLAPFIVLIFQLYCISTLFNCTPLLLKEMNKIVIWRAFVAYSHNHSYLQTFQFCKSIQIGFNKVLEAYKAVKKKIAFNSSFTMQTT